MVVSRAAFLRGAGLAVTGASVAAVLGCSRASRATRGPTGPPATRADLRASLPDLQAALAREHESILAYTAAIPMLSGRRLEAAKHFLWHEYAHAAQLSSLITRGGGRPVELEAARYDLGAPADEDEALGVLGEVEQGAIAAHLEALTRLPAGPVRSALAATLAADAQHLAVLRAQRGRPPVPSPLLSATPVGGA